MKKIPKINPSDSLLREDNLAINESASIEDEDYTREAKKSEHSRRERLRFHAGIAGILIFWLMASILIGMIFCWGWNILAPTYWHFLTEIQLDRIQTILFTASIVELLPAFVKKYL